MELLDDGFGGGVSCRREAHVGRAREIDMLGSGRPSRRGIPPLYWLVRTQAQECRRHRLLFVLRWVREAGRKAAGWGDVGSLGERR